MTRRERLRRAGILCLHCLRNVAFYRAWYEAGQPKKGDQLWINVNNNFIDIAILEWCKVLGDHKGKQHFSKVLESPKQFEQELLQTLKITSEDFKAYIGEVRTYRDKFIAHLDEEPVMNVPHLDIAQQSAEFLYQRLRGQEADKDTFDGAPASAKDFYDHFFKWA